MKKKPRRKKLRQPKPNLRKILSQMRRRKKIKKKI